MTRIERITARLTLLARLAEITDQALDIMDALESMDDDLEDDRLKIEPVGMSHLMPRRTYRTHGLALLPLELPAQTFLLAD